jgi:hypothetical protein
MSVLTDAIAGDDLMRGDSERALKDIRMAGARFTTVTDIVNQNLGQFPTNGLGPPSNV